MEESEKKTAVEKSILKEEKTVVEKKFLKSALMESKLFREQRDILSAVLEDGREYSKSEAQKLIKKYLKKEMA